MEVIPMKNTPVDVIICYLHQWFLLNFAFSEPSPHQFYCGITNDLDGRFSTHECEEGKEIKLKIAIECDNERIAAEVEDHMGKLGFDIGNPPHKGNGAAPDQAHISIQEAIN